MTETPQDPFISSESENLMSGLQMLYAAALRAGFPEQRAFDLIDHFFLQYMTTAAVIAAEQIQQEG